LENKESLEELKREIGDCRRCDLWKTRTHLVFGDGNPNAKVMLIGEAPGFYEDKEGIPFVGAAGKFLNKLLESVSLKRKDIYIANILKCRPPKNRDPLPEEIEACSPFLDRQIDIIKPKIIICLGRFASKYILDKFGFSDADSISKIHGKIFVSNTPFGILKIIPMYHPASALYRNELKEVLLSDWSRIKDLILKI